MKEGTLEAINEIIKTKNLVLNEFDYQRLYKEVYELREKGLKKELQRIKQNFLMTDKFPEISDRFVNPN